MKTYKDMSGYPGKGDRESKEGKLLATLIEHLIIRNKSDGLEEFPFSIAWQCRNLLQYLGSIQLRLGPSLYTRLPNTMTTRPCNSCNSR